MPEAMPKAALALGEAKTHPRAVPVQERGSASNPAPAVLELQLRTAAALERGPERRPTVVPGPGKEALLHARLWVKAQRSRLRPVGAQDPRRRRVSMPPPPPASGQPWERMA